MPLHLILYNTAAKVVKIGRNAKIIAIYFVFCLIIRIFAQKYRLNDEEVFDINDICGAGLVSLGTADKRA
jgi:prolipoprotein diacylglyceryltransferase